MMTASAGKGLSIVCPSRAFDSASWVAHDIGLRSTVGGARTKLKTFRSMSGEVALGMRGLLRPLGVESCRALVIEVGEPRGP